MTSTYGIHGTTYGGWGPMYGSSPGFDLTQPLFQFQFAFGNNPLDVSPTWTTIPSGDVKAVHIKRGRQHELSRFQTGVCTLELDNRSGKYDPNNTSGAYYPNVKIFVPVRVQATYGGTTYTIFQGFVESWPQKYASIGDSDVTVTCVDAFKLLNLALLTSTLYAAAIVADGATAYYRLDETVANGVFADSSGHGNNATIPGLDTWTRGVAGAIQGDTDTAVSANNSTLNLPSSIAWGTSGYTIELWHKPNSRSPAADPSLWNVGGLADGGYISYSGTTPLVNFYAYDGSTHTLTTPTGLTTDAWHHLMFVRGASTMTLYVDGAAAASGAIGAMTAGATGGLTQVSTAGLDEFAIYVGTPLTATQASTHYQYGATTFAVQPSGQRIGTVLDLLGWPAAQRALDTGRSQVQGAATSLRTTSALSYLQTVETSENGSLFVSADGKITFYDRYKLQGSPFTTSQVTMGDAAGEEPYESGPDITYDDLDVYNDVTAQRVGGVAQRVTDTASITAYGTRSRSLTGLLNITDLEVTDRAGFELTRYKTPKSRIASVHAHPMDDAAVLFPQVMGRDLLSRITVKRRPLGYTTFNQDSFIEGIEHTITPDDWHTIWSTVPVSGAGYATSFFTLDDTTLGVLDTNALGY